jgi:monovalent cation:H+ antiporter, CPA1 family
LPTDDFVVTAVLAVVALLFMATLTAAVTNRLKLPLSVTLVCVGLLLGWLGRFVPPLAPIAALTLSPEVLTYIFMPTLIFEAAFAINARMLGQNLLQVMLLSVPVLIASFLLVAFGMNWAIGLPIGAALLFGAFVSATDSAAVLGVLQEIGAPRRLNVIIQGENLLNDATSIVLFNIVVAAIGMAAAQSLETGEMLRGAVFAFCWNFFGGLAAGAAMGWFTSKVIYWIENDDLIEIVLTTSMA